jgi:hypothetical protein
MRRNRGGIDMKARGLFITGLLLTALFAAFHMGYLADILTSLPEDIQIVLGIWVLEGKSIDWQFASLAATLVGMFSLTLKKKEEF